MHILNINSSIDLKSGGGTAERTFQMSRFMAKHGATCTVLTLDIGLSNSRVVALAPAKAVVLPCIWPRFYVPWLKWKTIRREVQDADFIHLMGHWSILNAFAYLAVRLSGKPYAVCPAGSLLLFGRSGWLKRIYNMLVGNSIIRNATAWIAVTQGEFPHFEAYGIPSSRITVIPNGVNEEEFPVTDTEKFLNRSGLPVSPLILFMGRLNQIKGPDLLLQAFLRVQACLPEFHLVFAGPDGGMHSQLSHIVDQEGLSERVHFLGYVSGEDKSATYRSAKLLVVPSRQEAMSIVALEAGICGIPVLLTDQCGFNDVSKLDPRLEVSATVTGLAEGLTKLLSNPDVLKGIAPVWHDYVTEYYAWDVIVNSYLELYGHILRKQKDK
ncbi:MAG: glycosyltransferase [Candidatus Thiodiazotropha sp. (ex Myrtea spinifera)]|nr:glycosyltransferase [Candidatus Thiodiazotropha sp. (ex Myrtea spinifera)]